MAYFMGKGLSTILSSRMVNGRWFLIFKDNLEMDRNVALESKKVTKTYIEDNSTRIAVKVWVVYKILLVTSSTVATRKDF